MTAFPTNSHSCSRLRTGLRALASDKSCRVVFIWRGSPNGAPWSIFVENPCACSLDCAKIQTSDHWDHVAAVDMQHRWKFAVDEQFIHFPAAAAPAARWRRVGRRSCAKQRHCSTDVIRRVSYAISGGRTVSLPPLAWFVEQTLVCSCLRSCLLLLIRIPG